MVWGVTKIFKNEFNLCCKGADPRIYENSIFTAYVPEKNKIITPCPYACFPLPKFTELTFKNVFGPSPKIQYPSPAPNQVFALRNRTARWENWPPAANTYDNNS